MKYLQLFVLLISLGFKVCAQEKALAKIHYDFKHINDTTHKEFPKQDFVVSYLGKHSYYYTSYSDDIVKKQIEDQKALSSYAGQLTLKLTTTPILTHYLIYSDQQKTVKLEGISSTFDIFTLDDSYESQNWTLQDEQQEIGGYKCQKATTRFKGRNYVAWFTTELPFPFGPWKLHGLPGLILSAHDDKQEVIFNYAGFDKENVDKLIHSPTYAISASTSELNKLKKAFKDNPNTYYNILQSSGRMALTNDYYGIDYSKMSIDFDHEDYKPSLQENNPMELIAY